MTIHPKFQRKVQQAWKNAVRLAGRKSTRRGRNWAYWADEMGRWLAKGIQHSNKCYRDGKPIEGKGVFSSLKP